MASWQDFLDGLKKAGDVYQGASEGLATTATGLAAMPVAGWKGLTTLMAGGDLQAASKAMEESARGLTYEPQTPMGEKAAGAIAYPLEKMNEATGWLGDRAMDATGSPLVGGAVKTAADWYAPLAAGKAFGAAKGALRGKPAPRPTVDLKADFDRWLSERNPPAPPAAPAAMSVEEAMRLFREGADITPEIKRALLGERAEAKPIPKGTEPWDERPDALGRKLDYYEAGGTLPSASVPSNARGMARPGTVSEFPELPRDLPVLPPHEGTPSLPFRGHAYPQPAGTPGAPRRPATDTAAAALERAQAQRLLPAAREPHEVRFPNSQPVKSPSMEAAGAGGPVVEHGQMPMNLIPEGQYFRDWNGHVYLKEPGGKVRFMQRAGDPNAGNPIRHGQGQGEPLKVTSYTDPGMDRMMVDRIPDPFPAASTPEQAPRGSTHVDPAPLPPPTPKDIVGQFPRPSQVPPEIPVEVEAPRGRRVPQPGSEDWLNLIDLETGEGVKRQNGNLYRRIEGDRLRLAEVGDPSAAIYHDAGLGKARMHEGSETDIGHHISGAYQPADLAKEVVQEAAGRDRFSPGHPIERVRQNLQTGEAWRQDWQPSQNGVYQRLHGGEKFRRIEGNAERGYFHEGGGGERMGLGSETDFSQDGNRALGGNYVPRAEVARLLEAMGEKAPLVDDIRAYANLEPVEIRQPKAANPEVIPGRNIRTGEALDRAMEGMGAGNLWRKLPDGKWKLERRDFQAIRHGKREQGEWMNQGSVTDANNHPMFDHSWWRGGRVGGEPAPGQVEMGGPAFEEKALRKDRHDEWRRGGLKKQIRRQGGDANPDVPEAVYREVAEEAAGRRPTVEEQPDFFKHPEWRMPEKANSNYAARHPEEGQGSFSAARGNRGWIGVDRADRATFNVHAEEPARQGRTIEAKRAIKNAGGSRNPTEAGRALDADLNRSAADRAMREHLAALDAGNEPPLGHRFADPTAEGQQRFPFQVEHKRELLREKMLRDRTQPGTDDLHRLDKDRNPPEQNARWNRENRGLPPEESGEKPYRNYDAREERIAREEEGQIYFNDVQGLKPEGEFKYQDKAELEVGMGPENAGLRDRELARPADERARLFRQMFGEVYDLNNPWENLERRQGGPSVPPKRAGVGKAMNSLDEPVGDTVYGPLGTNTEKAERRFNRRFGFDPERVTKVEDTGNYRANIERTAGPVKAAVRAEKKARRDANRPPRDPRAAGAPVDVDNLPTSVKGRMGQVDDLQAYLESDHYTDTIRPQIEGYPVVEEGKGVPNFKGAGLDPREMGLDPNDPNTARLVKIWEDAMNKRGAIFNSTAMVNRADPNFPVGEVRYFGGHRHENFFDEGGGRFQDAGDWRGAPPGWEAGFVDLTGKFYDRVQADEVMAAKGKGAQRGKAMAEDVGTWQTDVGFSEADLKALRDAKAAGDEAKVRRLQAEMVRQRKVEQGSAPPPRIDEQRLLERHNEMLDALTPEERAERLRFNPENEPSPGEQEVYRQYVRDQEKLRRRQESPKAKLMEEMRNWKPEEERTLGDRWISAGEAGDRSNYHLPPSAQGNAFQELQQALAEDRAKRAKEKKKGSKKRKK